MTIREEQREIKASVLEYLADSFAAIERFGRAKKEFLADFLDLESGIPSHDTFGRVFASLDPSALQEAFRAWVASLVEVSKGEVVAIAGRTLQNQPSLLAEVAVAFFSSRGVAEARHSRHGTVRAQ